MSSDPWVVVGTSILEEETQAHGDEAGAVLRAGGAPEVDVSNGAVDAEVGLVERIECVGAELQADAVSIAAGPHTELFYQRNVVDEYRGMAELAVVLRRSSEAELRRY